MSFVSSLRSFRRTRRPVERALAAASTAKFRHEITIAAAERVGIPPRF